MGKLTQNQQFSGGVHPIEVFKRVRYLPDLKKILISLALIIGSGRTMVWAQADCAHEEYFNHDGTISSKFWELTPTFLTGKPQPVGFIQREDLLYLIRVAKEPVTGFVHKTLPHKKESLVYPTPDDDSEYEIAYQEWLKSPQSLSFRRRQEAIQTLGRLEFFGAKDESNPVSRQPGLSDLQKIDDRFYRCDTDLLFSNIWLIDSKSPPTAYDLGGTCNQNWGTEGITLTHIEYPQQDVCRVFLSNYPGNGRFAGYPNVKVFDIDLKKKTIRDVEGSFSKDLEGKGHHQLIVGCEVAWNMEWYWVYTDMDGNWVEVSDRYPDFYKKDVLKIYQALGDQGNYEYIRKALMRAAELGGPSANKK
jgi:hypothetical protein